MTLGDETLEELWPALLERVGPAQALRQALAGWCMADPRPLVLLIDEIDALMGDTLLSVLRQLRTGYVDRPRRFPHSIVLCGLREERVRRVIEPILAGADRQMWSSEDVAYVHDLGLVAQDAGGLLRIANPIYAEVVPRHLNHAVQIGLPQRMAWYVDALTAPWTWRGWSRHSRRSSGSTPNTGCCCRRTCSGW